MAGWSKMVSMELDDEDKLDFCAPMPCDRPDYPFGLRITFCDKELKKLGLSKPDIGDMIDMRAFGVVTSCSSEQVDGGEERVRVEIQIQRISVENEANE
jgi:hypothetical protein